VAEKKELLLIEIREDGARVVKRNIQDLGTVGDKVTTQMDRLKTVLGGLISARVIRDTIMLADSYTNMLNRLRVVTDSTWELGAAMGHIVQMSRETRTALEGNVEMYNRIAINTKQMGLRMEDVIKFSRQLNHAIILSGVTAREAHWGMVQFSQGLAAGALRGDELRAVMEQLPVVTQTLTRYLGIGRGELRKWAFEGRVTTKVIIDAFNDAEESLAERFGKRIPTVDQALTVLNNSLVRFIGTIDQAIQGTGTLAKAILWVGDNMETLGRLALVAGVIIGSIFLKNLITVVAQMKLFSLAAIAAHPLATAFLAAAGAVLIFSNKIRIANDSTATLADFLGELGKNAKVAYGAIRDGIATLIKGGDIHTQTAITFEQILVDSAAFLDFFLGGFVGAGQVIVKFFKDIPNGAKAAWNLLIDGFEWVIDSIIAGFATIGDMLGIFFTNAVIAMKNLAEAGKQAMAGNTREAARFADQAAFFIKKAASDGFGSWGELFEKNARITAEDQAFAGIKFQMEDTGETFAEAFWRGFKQSNIFSTGMADLLERVRNIAKAGDPREDLTKVFHPSTIQQELLKDMLGDVGKLNTQMKELNEMWIAINTQQPGTEGMSVTLEQVNRKMTELRLKTLEVATDMGTGFERGFLKVGLEITNFADMAEQTIVNAFSSMEDALVSFVTTGKVDFKELVDSILADLTRLLARQALVALFGGPGALLGGLAGGGGSTNPMAVFGAPGRATGGQVSPGTSYLVGERGQPELFQSAQPGRITPMSQVAAEPAAPTPVTIINVSSEEEAIAAMQSAEGTRVIKNVIRTTGTGGIN
jgi:tape measure domain-containing protein